MSAPSTGRLDDPKVKRNQAARAPVALTQVFDPPYLSQRSVRRGATLAVLLHAMYEKQGRWRVQVAVIEQGTPWRDLGRIDWANAYHNGEVLYPANSCCTGSQRATCCWRLNPSF